MTDDATGNDETDVPVDAVGGIGSGPGETPDDMADEIEELRELLADVDAENVAHVACIVQYKHRDPDTDADGVQWRVTDPSLDGYETPTDVIGAAVSYNDALDGLEIPVEMPEPSNPLEAMFSAAGPSPGTNPGSNGGGDE